MINSNNILTGIIVLMLLLINSGCVSQPQEPTPVPTPTSTVPVIQNYLSTSDETCGKCHFTAFDLMSQEGGKHNKGCTFCHFQHGIKPKCTQCHGLIHGTQIQDCKNCHDEHAPLRVLSSSTLEEYCTRCHPHQMGEFSNYPGRHADLKCIHCHQVHRHIESCINCHAPHSTELTYEDCLICHPAHMPQEIDYPESIANTNCAFCHEAVSNALVEGDTKHSTLGCSYCHEVHEMIPECQDCHTPHTPDMINEDCIGCHPAHNPMDMEFPVDAGEESCAVCHREIDAILRGSNTKHDELGCIYCHPQHRYLPTCESCHGLPHEKIHENFPVCLQCHIVSHDVKNIIFTR